MPRLGDIDLANAATAPQDLEQIVEVAASAGTGRHAAIDALAKDIGMKPESLRRSWRMWTTGGLRRVPNRLTIERIREAARKRGWL